MKQQSSSPSTATKSASPIPASSTFRSKPSSPSSTSSATTLRSHPARCYGIRDRPIVLKRFVNGAEGEAFYQKRAPADRPAWLRTVTLSFPSGRTAEEVVVDDAAGLAWIVEPWLHRASSACRPHRRPRPSRRTARRSRSRPRRRLGRRPPRRPRSASSSRRGGPARLAQDQRLPRHARQRAHPAALDLHRSPPRRPRTLPRRRAPRSQRWPAPSGGRKSATASSSTTTRTPRTAPPAPPTRCARCPMRASPRRCDWDEVPDCEPADFTVADHAGAICRHRRSARRDGHARLARSTSFSSSPRTTKPKGSATPRGRRTSARWKAKPRASRPRAPRSAERSSGKDSAEEASRQDAAAYHR